MTPRLAPGTRLVVASHNPGKVREIADLITPYGMNAISAADLGLAEPEETGETFAENALLKARAAAVASGLPALADDSGLEVCALGGAPGIYSARWAGPDKDFRIAMQKVHDRLDALPTDARQHDAANFTCALSLAFADGRHREFEGKVCGHLTWPPRGEKGFGYDPIFIPEGHDITFGEMEPAMKHAMSHRAKAFEQFVDVCLRKA